MNTNQADTGVVVSLRKVGNDVHLELETSAGRSGVVLDDSKTVYTALHDAKDRIAEAIGMLHDAATDWAAERSDAAAKTIDGRPREEKLALWEPANAAAVLDGKQVATSVALPDDDLAVPVHTEPRPAA